MPVVNTTEDRTILDALSIVLMHTDAKHERDNIKMLATEVLFELLSMRPTDRTKLAERLLREPPHDGVKDALPLLLYFRTDLDRREFEALIHHLKPNLTAHEAP